MSACQAARKLHHRSANGLQGQAAAGNFNV